MLIIIFHNFPKVKTCSPCYRHSLSLYPKGTVHLSKVLTRQIQFSNFYAIGNSAIATATTGNANKAKYVFTETRLTMEI